MAETGPGGNSRSLKRQWFELYGEASTPPRLAKRVAKSRTYEREDYRQEIAGVYAAYDALFKGCHEGHAQETDFVALLKAAEGSEPTKRLVARLLPRFVKHFPKHARATGDVLTDLAQLSLTDAPSSAADTRADALHGLCAVLSAAKLATDHQTAIRLVDYAFRQLKSLPAASLPPPHQPNGTPAPHKQGGAPSPTPGTPPFAAAGVGDAGGAARPTHPGKPPSLASHAAAPYLALLESAFTHFPRVVLAACLHSLKRPSQHPELFAAARQFVVERLLGPRRGGSAAGEAAGGAGEGGGDPPSPPTSLQQQQQQYPQAVGAGRGEPPREGLSAASVQASAPPQSGGEVAAKAEDVEAGVGGLPLGEQSLFREVMLAEGREQRWFRQHVQQFLQELPASAGADACMVLQQLVRELPPSPQRPPQPQEAPPSGAQRPGREDGLVNGSQKAQHGHSPPQQQQQLLQKAGAALPAECQQRGSKGPKGAGGGLAPPSHTPTPSRGAGHAGGGFRSGSCQDLTQGLTPARGPSPHPSAVTPHPSGGAEVRHPPGSGGWGGSRHAAVTPAPMDVGGEGGGAPANGPAPEGSGYPGEGGAGDPPPPFPPPGDNVCLAAACLWIHGLPAYLDEGDISKECGRHGRVAGAVMPPPTPGQPCVAHVNFVSVRDAMRCYEAMCDAAPWRGCLPLDIRFCSSEAFPPTAPQPPTQPPCTHTWVAGVSNMGEEGEVLRCCKEGGVPAPEHLLRVGGRRPGLLLSFATQAAAAAAVTAVQAGHLRLSGLLPLGGPGAQDPSFADPPPPLAPLGSTPLGGGRDSLARGPVGEAPPSRPLFDRPIGVPLDGGPLGGAGGGGDLGGGVPPPGPDPQYDPRLPPPEFMSRTLWVGQIPPNMRDAELLQAFAACGELVGHKFMRHTNCAFVDFATQVGATEARKKLDGARVGPAILRVEYKNEKQWWAGQGGRGPPPPAAAAGGGAHAAGVGREREPPLAHTPGEFVPQGRGFRDGPQHQYHPPFREAPPHPPQQQPPFDRGFRGAPPSAAFSATPASGSMDIDIAGASGSYPAGGTPSGWPPGRTSGRLQAPVQRDGAAPFRAVGGKEGEGARGMQRMESAMSLGAMSSAASGALPPAARFAPGGPPQEAHRASAALQPQPLVPPAQQQPAWEGRLAKSKVPVCDVQCLDGPERQRGPGLSPSSSWAFAEPQHWPAMLDVGMRADLQYVCGTVFPQVAPGQRAVRRVTPLDDPAHRKAFSEFVRYLEGKSRAGVVKLPSLQPGGPRVMYLIPPSTQTCAALGVAMGGAADFMVALVVPAAAK